MSDAAVKEQLAHVQEQLKLEKTAKLALKQQLEAVEQQLENERARNALLQGPSDSLGCEWLSSEPAHDAHALSGPRSMHASFAGQKGRPVQAAAVRKVALNQIATSPASIRPAAEMSDVPTGGARVKCPGCGIRLLLKARGERGGL